MRSNQSNPIDLPDDIPSMECIECEEKFSPVAARAYGGVCPYCGFALTEDEDDEPPDSMCSSCEFKCSGEDAKLNDGICPKCDARLME